MALEHWPAAAAAKSLQSCPTLCDPIGGSPPDSPVPGILQARTLEWVAISFSNTWKWKVKVKSLSRVRLLATPWTAAYQAPPSMGFSRQKYWSGVPLPSPGTLAYQRPKVKLPWWWKNRSLPTSLKSIRVYWAQTTCSAQCQTQQVTSKDYKTIPVYSAHHLQSSYGSGRNWREPASEQGKQPSEWPYTLLYEDM